MIFSNLTVDENLAMGAYLQNDARPATRRIAITSSRSFPA